MNILGKTFCIIAANMFVSGLILAVHGPRDDMSADLWRFTADFSMICGAFVGGGMFMIWSLGRKR